MPLSWKISPLERIAVCVCEGVVTVEDIWRFYNALEEAGGMPYRKIIDSKTGSLELSNAELDRLTTRTNRVRQGVSVGAIAFVAPSRRNTGLAKLLRGLATIDRPMRVFLNIHDARRWLESRPPARPPRRSRSSLP